jgi:hypothetical protein
MISPLPLPPHARDVWQCSIVCCFHSLSCAIPTQANSFLLDSTRKHPRGVHVCIARIVRLLPRVPFFLSLSLSLLFAYAMCVTTALYASNHTSCKSFSGLQRGRKGRRRGGGQVVESASEQRCACSLGHSLLPHTKCNLHSLSLCLSYTNRL